MAPIDKDRQGRGRLSRLDMLPEEAQPHLVWLNQELRAGKRPQNELRDVFNAHLAGLGIEPISNGSFSRYSVRKAMQFRDMDETLRLSSELVEVLGVDSSDRMTIALAEMLKVAAVKLIETEGGNLAAKDLMELAKAAQAATSAQKASADYRRMLERELLAKVEDAAKDVAEIGKAAGVSEEAMRMINQRLAGIG
jgi:hypothetical protein